MKKLLLPFMVLAVVLASCGKDNKVGGTGTQFSPITTNVQGASQLGQLIDNYTNTFGLGSTLYSGYPYTYKQIIDSGANIVYRYTKSTSTYSSSSPNCDKKWGIFYVCSYSNTTTPMPNVTESRPGVPNLSVDVHSKANELKSIINRANPLIPIQSSGYSYLITTNDGVQYIIDTRYPLQANPIGIRTSTYTEYLYNITAN